MSELLPIDSPLLPRLRKAAAKDDDALRWLMDSARHWARGEFLRREMEGIGPKTREHVRGAMYELELLQVAVRFGSLSAPGRRFLVDNERTAVGLLCEGCNEEYLDLQTGRAEKISGMFYISDVFLLPPEFRCSRWIRPAPPPRPAVGSYRDGYFDQAQLDQAQQATAEKFVRLQSGDSYTYTTTVTMS